MVTFALIRTPKLQNGKIKVQFSRRRIEVNYPNGLLKTDLKFWDNLQQYYRTFFSKSIFKLDISRWSKNAKFYGKFFLLNVCGLCRKINSKNSGRDGWSCGHLVQPVQLFESSKFCDYGSTLTCYISWLVFFLTWEITGTQVFYPSKTPKNKMKKI